MPRTAEGSGATVDEAVEAALTELGATRDEARIEVVQEPKGGVLGVGGRDALVRVTVGGVAARADAPGSTSVDLEEQADAVADFVDELLVKMDIDAIAEPNARGSHMYVDIVDGPEDDMALLIGRHGQTLEAIQELARMAVGRRMDERIRVIVDVEDYRKRREERLEEHAREVAERIADEGGEQELEPMNPYERKLVHDAVAEIDGVETISRGEEPNRFVVIRAV